MSSSQQQDITHCQHCAQLIRPPKPGSYPSAVEWVHERSLGENGNRWCSVTERTTAAPMIDMAETEV